MRIMRIAYISYYFLPVDHIGAGSPMHYTANAYGRHGYQVTMFSPYSQRAANALYKIIQVPVGVINRTFPIAWNMRSQDSDGFYLLHAAGDDYWMLGKKRPYHIGTFDGSCFADIQRTAGDSRKLRRCYLFAPKSIGNQSNDDEPATNTRKHSFP